MTLASLLTRIAPALLALVAATPAFAGGIGYVGGGGLRTQPVYWYLDGDANEQYRQNQKVAMMSHGLEFSLGDRDERFLGFFRAYWLREGAEKDPSLFVANVSSDEVVAAWRDAPRDVGMFTLGMSIGVIGQPKTVMGTIVADVGSGFLTVDHSEFLQAEVGPGITWMAVRGVQVYGNAAYAVRWRKGFMNGVSGSAGVRYLFD